MNASWLPRRAAAKNVFAPLDFRFVWFALMLELTHAAGQRSTLPNNMHTKRNTPHTLQPANRSLADYGTRICENGQSLRAADQDFACC